MDRILARRGVTKIILMAWSWGTVIAGALLYLKGGYATRSWEHGEGQNSEADGKFTLKVEPGPVVLAASKPGYHTRGGTYDTSLPAKTSSSDRRPAADRSDPAQEITSGALSAACALP